MAIALPITQNDALPHNDPRHYTDWDQVLAPQVVSANPANPIPEDVGTPNAPQHYTQWEQVIAPQVADANPFDIPKDEGAIAPVQHYTEWEQKPR